MSWVGEEGTFARRVVVRLVVLEQSFDDALDSTHKRRLVFQLFDAGRRDLLGEDFGAPLEGRTRQGLLRGQALECHHVLV